MRVGDLVSSRHDPCYQGIVMETAPGLTKIDHGDNVVRVRWFDGDETYEFHKMLRILSKND